MAANVTKDEFINAIFAMSVDPERFESATLGEASAAWPEMNKEMMENAKRYEAKVGN